jgi:hypothetical protein
MKKYKIRFHPTKKDKEISNSYAITGWADSEEEFLARLKEEYPTCEVFSESLTRME